MKMKRKSTAKEYRLLALDMDGTVLNSEKKITSHTASAMHEAMARGKEVLFATGRCPTEVREDLKAFPEMNYVLCLSGALVLDLRCGETLANVTISRELVEKILSVADGLDAMVTLYAGDDVFVEHKRKGNMTYYGCQCFAKLYDDCAVWVENIRDVLITHGDCVHKANIFCHSPEEWKKADEGLRGLPLNYASGIPNNYEISPCGVDKGVGLKKLCEATGISIQQSIAVGDEGNDVAMIKAAGLGVAMGNAPEWIQKLADWVTSDCDHDGVAEVIETYLLD